MDNGYGEVKTMNKGELMEMLDTLPTAVSKPVFYETEEADKVEVPSRAIVDEKTGKLYTVASEGYCLINHKDAFSRIINSLSIPEDAQIDARVSSYEGVAKLHILFDSLKIDDGAEGIKMGIEVVNSYNRTKALGLQLQRRTFSRNEKTIIFYGMRQICSNGMRIKVPLSEMSNQEIDKLNPLKDITAEEKTFEHIDRIEGRIVHYGKNTFNYKFRDLQETVFRVSNYIQSVIDKAINERLDEKQFEVVLKNMPLPEKIRKGLIDDFAHQSMTTWNAYNLITAHASHEVKNLQTQELLLDLAWDKLMVPPIQAR